MLAVPRHWTFDAPTRLLLLLVVAGLAAAYLLLQRRRPSYEARFSDVDLLASVLPRRPGWRRHLPAAVLLLALVAMTTAFARPRADVKVPRERATVVIALDVSGSMQATDVSPSRLAAAKAAAVRFVGSLPKTFDVGLVSFSSAATVQVPPTLDHVSVAGAINDLTYGGGTAIGDAVAASVAAAQGVAVNAGAAKTPSRVVLLSDGGNTVGQPVQAGAAQAQAASIPVSTIAYGTDQGVVQVQGRLIPVPVDKPALEALASSTAGTAYTAASGDQLQHAYDDIGRQVGTKTAHRDETAAVTGLALLLALGAAAASLVWFRVLP
jgi:Ca-activated chloride channel family protein